MPRIITNLWFDVAAIRAAADGAGIRTSPAS